MVGCEESAASSDYRRTGMRFVRDLLIDREWPWLRGLSEGSVYAVPSERPHLARACANPKTARINTFQKTTPL